MQDTDKTICKYKFSVVMPIYNVEKYLDDSIKSVTNQTIGFRENIQLILVNDGSTDNSEQICIKYKRMFPDNIIYLRQENLGVSAARNAGAKYIQGKYVNFLDSDDKWSLDAFEKVWKYFEDNQDKIGLVSCRMKFFDEREDYHLLDYKFENTKIVNILEDYNFIQLHITSTFLKSELVKKFSFDERLKFGEDAKYISEIVLETGKYSVFNETTHFYRKRSDGTSAIQNKEQSIDWYTKTVQYSYYELIELSRKKYGKVIRYIQYLIMYDMQWRIKRVIPNFLDGKMKNQYIKDIKNILQIIDDNIICEQHNIHSEHKIFIFSLKYGKDIRKYLEYKNGRLYYKDNKLYNIKNNGSILKITELNIIDKTLIIEGIIKSPLEKGDFEIYVKVNKDERKTLKLLECDNEDINKKTIIFNNNKALNYYTYKFSIPIEGLDKLRFVYKYKQNENKLKIRFGEDARLSNYDGSCCKIEKYMFEYIDRNINIKNENKTEDKNNNKGANNLGRIKINFKDDLLFLEKDSVRKNKNLLEKIDIRNLNYGDTYTSNIQATSSKDKNKILFFQEIEGFEKTNNYQNIEDDGQYEDDNNNDNDNLSESYKKQDAIIVYSVNGKIRYSFCDLEKALKKFVQLKYKIVELKLNKHQFKIVIIAYLLNKSKAEIGETKFFADGETYKECKLKQYSKQISKLKMITDKNFYKFSFKLKDILKDESTINGSVRFEVMVNGYPIEYKVGIRDKKIVSGKIAKKYYNLPIKGLYTGNFAVHIRRTIAGNLVLVQRMIEPIEKTLKYKFFESKLISFLLYHIGKFGANIRKKKINLFYEKFASKAEEGVYDLYTKCKQSKKTKNYFVIDKNSPDYLKIKSDKNVIKKYSLKFYWLFYNTSYFIASEAPSHLNVLRSNNKYFRRATYDKKFVFLQHGIIYMKNLGVNSSFKKGKEGEAQYMVVSSEKEKEVVAEMLDYNEEQLLKTGLGMYSKIKYKHINQDSEDYVTVMLTWKPYEEQLYDFEQSSYYQNVIEITDMLKKYIDRDKIILISHPKAESLLINTDLKDRIWNKPISEALEKTKLLITDYSSVCYNTFYQGGGVIFYQPDLQLYESENGPLIPDKDEYIGKRAYNLKELEKIIKKTIKNKKINLDEVRTEKFEENYKTINEFSDGKNIDRIYEKLTQLNII